MTIEEFNAAKFAKGDSVKYDGIIYPITGINFIEKLFELKTECFPKDTYYFHVRCENV